MNTYNISDQNFINSVTYQQFIRQNPSQGYLKIRAFAANQAIPISGLKVIVSTIIDNDNVIFFFFFTNSSGVIENIILPAPKLNPNDLDVPNSIIYDVSITYMPDNFNQTYKVNIYENLGVIQNINIVPDMKSKLGGL